MKKNTPSLILLATTLGLSAHATAPDAPPETSLPNIQLTSSSPSWKRADDAYKKEDDRTKAWDFEVLLGRSLHPGASGLMGGAGVSREVYFGKMGISISLNAMGDKTQYYISVPRILWKLLFYNSPAFSFSGGTGLSFGFSGVKYNKREVVKVFSYGQSTHTEYDEYRSRGAIVEATLGSKIHFHEKIHGIVDVRGSLPVTPSIGKLILSVGFGVSY